ncbi:Copine-1 [Orchesella cincta]|uniref:Copine-1 n=1 Tax=Orchesella cincta TaxID=48709 RepID=A0A1D2NBR0_ORCCI|nr:Copine-1 [Orchesella cincta]
MLKHLLVIGGLVSLALCQESRNLTFTLAAKGLPAKDDISKIDPLVRVYQTTDGSDLEKFGASETILDTDDPEWVEVFWFLWKKGSNQKWKFEIRDADILDKDDALGGAEINVDEYVAGGENMTLNLSPQGTLMVQKTTPIRFQLKAESLPKKDKPPQIFAAFTSDQGESDPYVKCYYRRGIGGEDKKFATTSTIDNVVDAAWDEIIEFGNYQKGTGMYLRFKVKDADSTSKDDDVGYALMEVDPFVEANVPKTLKVQNDNGEENGATLTVTPIKY